MKVTQLRMTRKDFIKLSAGIIGSLGIPTLTNGVLSPSQQDGSGSKRSTPKRYTLDDSYLVKGLTGMAKSDDWFNAHWGAGILAGYYLCKDNQIDEQTVAGIKSQLDLAIELRGDQFKQLPNEETDETLIEQVPQALVPAMKGGLRSHGHAVIFASLSTRALRDAPQLAQPKLINALCGHSRSITRNPLKKPDVADHYADTQAMIESLFDNLIRFKELLGHPNVRRPNFTHMTTHTEALMNLEEMGYGELARVGHAGHRAHVSEPVPVFDSKQAPKPNPATLKKMMGKKFWKNENNIENWKHKQTLPDNPNGDWIAAGHLFKVLYSFHRLIGRIKDKEKVKLCSSILLERYFDPSVNGG